MNPPSPSATAILLAGGSGARMGEAIPDKMLLPICGKPVLRYSIEAFASCETIDSIIVVYRDDAQKTSVEPFIPVDAFRHVEWVQGGERRQDSVWSGLSKLSSDCDVVLIHDGARPFIDPETIDTVAKASRDSGAACVARKVTDTIKQAKSSESGYTLKTISRSNLWAMETPQGFHMPVIIEGYRSTIESGPHVTDDLSAIEATNLPVSLIEIDAPNPKLTTPRDILLFEFLFNQRNEG
tara:strand:- start:69 stop:785 length:717 start_codon:yes stop_codon:yes gene_type:complete